MYFGTATGRVAFYALLVLISLPIVHLYGGSPSIAELREVNGVVTSIETRAG